MLESLTADHFIALKGEDFLLQVEGEEPIPLELVEVSVGESDPNRPSSARAPFVISFRGPADRPLPQRMFALEHRKLGELQLFIVPIRRDAGGLYYEAVFG